jgi:hypothetical protein
MNNDALVTLPANKLLFDMLSPIIVNIETEKFLMITVTLPVIEPKALPNTPEKYDYVVSFDPQIEIFYTVRLSTAFCSDLTKPTGPVILILLISLNDVF